MNITHYFEVVNKKFICFLLTFNYKKLIISWRVRVLSRLFLCITFRIHGCMMQKKGFSLIELVIVIAIIGVLMSIMVPALSRARKMVHVTTCASRMKNVAVATFMYAESNDDDLPPFKANSDFDTNILSLNNDTSLFADLDSENKWRNLGYLWEDGILDNGEVFYCSSPLASSRYKDYAIPEFPSGVVDQDLRAVNIVRSTFDYNPETRPYDSSFPGGLRRRYFVQQEMNSGTILLSDLISEKELSHERGWNITCGDMSVNYVINNKIRAYVQMGISNRDYSRRMALIKMLVDEIQ